MKFIDNMLFGLILGTVLPFVSFFTYYKVKFDGMGYYHFMRHLELANIFDSVLSGCIIANIISFFLLLWRKKERGAQGVLGATIIWAVIIVVLKGIE